MQVRQIVDSVNSLAGCSCVAHSMSTHCSLPSTGLYGTTTTSIFRLSFQAPAPRPPPTVH